MINKILIFFVLLVGCSDNNNQNFDILNEKFNEWYAHVYNNEIFINNLDIALRNEFIQDLRRFEFEFSQISQKNLKPDKRKSYNIIIYRIKNLILNHETIDNYNQDPSKITLHFYYRLLNAFESTTPFDINHDIEYLENLISDIKENYTNVFPGVKDRMISDINKSINLIEIYNTDEFWSTYNKFKDFKILADKFKKLKENLIQLKRWIVNNLSVNDKIVNDDKINIYEKQTENRIQDSYEYLDILKFINSTITSTQNTIFDFSLEIYLKDNDEPIWIDRDDSLGIINFVLNKKNALYLNDTTFCIDDNTKNPYTIIDKKTNKRIYEKCPKYNFHKHEKEIFEIANNFLDFEISINYFNRKYYKSSNSYIYEKYLVFPEYIDYNIKNQCDFIFNPLQNALIIEHVFIPLLLNKYHYNNAIVSNLNSNQTTLYAFKDIFFRILLEKSKKDIRLLYHLNKLRMLLKISLKHDYIYNNLSQSNAIDILVKDGFYNNKYAELVWEEIVYPNNYYLDKYLASVKLNEIYDDNCIINKELSNKEFILKMLKNISIPFYFFDEFLN